VSVLFVGLGGFIGSILRYGIGLLLKKTSWGGGFPLSTLGVNIVGCLAIGLLAGWAEQSSVVSANGRVFLFVGLLGGFTTFSSFGYETIGLLRTGNMLFACLNVGVQVIGGLLAVWLGLRIMTPA